MATAAVDAVWAHPRSRGENFIVTGTERFTAGSSPLTRGKQANEDLRPAPLGLIPAHAGKTIKQVKVVHGAEAHPRSRGENLVSTSVLPGVTGSSPLTRGKPDGGEEVAAHGRLIPAHAGKTSGTRSRPSPSPAHPRSRGENDEDGGAGALDDGSSPLTRGKL